MKIFIHTLFAFWICAPFVAAQTSGNAEAPDAGSPPVPKLVQEKPADTKPADVKPADVKPADVKPADVKPAEFKPAETSPKPDSKPATMPADTKPAVENPPQPASVPAKGPSKKERKRLPHLGSTNLPKIPGQPWRIHDVMRPRPSVVVPGETNAAPPSDAIILFDGTDLSQWYQRGEEEEMYEPQWNIVDGCLEVAPHTGSIYTIDSFASCQFHIEWMIPEGTKGTSQGRGNSGIKFMEKFEVQVLDSFKNRTYADGQAGSIYGQYPPLVNAVRKPGEWQTYDIFFEAPLFEEEKFIHGASMTVLHNGVLVQLHRPLAGPTGAREPKYTTMQPAAPIMLQDHGNPIRFRNIWIRPIP